jgi:hypothetical protein
MITDIACYESLKEDEGPARSQKLPFHNDRTARGGSSIYKNVPLTVDYVTVAAVTAAAKRRRKAFVNGDSRTQKQAGREGYLCFLASN